jgi:UDP-2,4-diacetamido-2,4,6-trideoxy-beta-L-altropyranose hydrolase
MRCLALAEALAPMASDIHFVCRRLQGELHGLIESRGFRCSLLATGDRPLDQANDARQTAALAGAVDWLTVDHYGLDRDWEQAMKPLYGKLLVIDDLVDRPHECDVLLDQTYGRCSDDYGDLVPEGCRVLAGTNYALLRPEFSALRPATLERRRASGGVHHILVSLGGFDPDNRTLGVLETLADSACSSELTVTVVCGAQYPNGGESLQALAGNFRRLDVLQHVTNMAELMASADLSVGAGGTTSWERCCLGLPALVYIMADNQREAAQGLEKAGAIRTWQSRHDLAGHLAEFTGDDALYRSAVAAASGICDGRGLERVVAEMQSC